MRQKDILKEILDNLPKVDFKEIYAKELYQRLAKETDSDVKKLLQDRLIPFRLPMRSRLSWFLRESGKLHTDWGMAW